MALLHTDVFAICHESFQYMVTEGFGHCRIEGEFRDHGDRDHGSTDVTKAFREAFDKLTFSIGLASIEARDEHNQSALVAAAVCLDIALRNASKYVGRPLEAFADAARSCQLFSHTTPTKTLNMCSRMASPVRHRPRAA